MSSTSLEGKEAEENQPSNVAKDNEEYFTGFSKPYSHDEAMCSGDSSLEVCNIPPRYTWSHSTVLPPLSRQSTSDSDIPEREIRSAVMHNLFGDLKPHLFIAHSVISGAKQIGRGLPKDDKLSGAYKRNASVRKHATYKMLPKLVPLSPPRRQEPYMTADMKLEDKFNVHFNQEYSLKSHKGSSKSLDDGNEKFQDNLNSILNDITLTEKVRGNGNCNGLNSEEIAKEFQLTNRLQSMKLGQVTSTSNGSTSASSPKYQSMHSEADERSHFNSTSSCSISPCSLDVIQQGSMNNTRIKPSETNRNDMEIVNDRKSVKTFENSNQTLKVHPKYYEFSKAKSAEVKYKKKPDFFRNDENCIELKEHHNLKRCIKVNQINPQTIYESSDSILNLESQTEQISHNSKNKQMKDKIAYFEMVPIQTYTIDYLKKNNQPSLQKTEVNDRTLNIQVEEDIQYSLPVSKNVGNYTQSNHSNDSGITKKSRNSSAGQILSERYHNKQIVFNEINLDFPTDSRSSSASNSKKSISRITSQINQVKQKTVDSPLTSNSSQDHYIKNLNATFRSVKHFSVNNLTNERRENSMEKSSTKLVTRTPPNLEYIDYPEGKIVAYRCRHNKLHYKMDKPKKNQETSTDFNIDNLVKLPDKSLDAPNIQTNKYMLEPTYYYVADKLLKVNKRAKACTVIVKKVKRSKEQTFNNENYESEGKVSLYYKDKQSTNKKVFDENTDIILEDSEHINNIVETNASLPENIRIGNWLYRPVKLEDTDHHYLSNPQVDIREESAPLCCLRVYKAIRSVFNKL